MQDKPIIAVKGYEDGFTYKYIRVAYCLGVPIEFSTDLSEEDFDKVIDEGLSY